MEAKTGTEIMTLTGGLSLDMRGCKFGDNWLSIDDSICDGDLQGILTVFRRADAAMIWWMGDFLCAVERLRGRARMTAMADMFGVSNAKVYMAAKVCALVAPDKRVEGASLWMHSEALAEVVTSVDDALAWVRKAQAEGMTVADMRRAIRASIKAVNGHAQKAMTAQRYAPIYQAIAAASRMPIESMDESDRETLIADTEPLWAWMARLREGGASGQ